MTPEQKQASKEYARRYYLANREKLLARKADYYAKNPDKIKAYSKTYHEKNAAQLTAKAIAWQAANPERYQQRQRSNYSAKRDRYIAAARARQQHIDERATPPWANQDRIRRLYAQATQLTRETGEVHEVDHEVPLTHPRVCGLHNEFNLRVVPRRVNRQKYNKFEAWV